jgi:uncharacterized protein
MKCPNCNETLLMTHRNNIEIDYCPTCRGVWLDKGELDKLLEYDAQSGSTPKYKGDDDHHYPRNDDRYKYSRKKKSFLGDLFDFG